MCRLLLLLFACPALILGQESALRLVRETEALTPEQEQAKLHAPEGFEVQLFASEPMINKPINAAFDAKGRLWVSSTVEYPYAAKQDRWTDTQGTHVRGSRDAIKILEDTDGDGRADKVTDFADELNIPTGVVPWHKPEHKAGCIAWSIPNIWYFADTDGDGKADLREVIFGPLGYEKDTHGMCSSFRLGLDGWVYATHGFSNTSQLEAKDGSKLDLHSGNVFRFRPDGSKVELYSAGQVNPFGLCWDRYNNLYSADCHSNPITQLLRGAHYPSFGKPHDGLGFAPNMCEHSHGSTGLCGIIYIDGGIWGPEWDDHMFVGNCVTSKVNHDRITFTGSTPKANEQPDFITSDDPWFRPVDLQLGPDNALYIADFYNKIIGHYEVPLEHPGRDKERGRIWRVVKKDAANQPQTNLTKLGAVELVQMLDSPNLTLRHQAVYQLADRLIGLGGKEASTLLSSNCKTPLQWAYALWSCHQVWLRTGRGIGFLDNNDDDFVDVHLLNCEAEGPTPQWRLAVTYTMSCLSPPERPGIPRTQLAAARALTNCLEGARSDAAMMMIEFIDHIPAEDVMLRHALKLSAKQMLMNDKVFGEIVQFMKDYPLPANASKKESEMQQAFESRLREISLAINTPAAADWLLDELGKAQQSPADLKLCLHQIARSCTAEKIDGLMKIAKRLTNSEQQEQIMALEELQNALLERGTPPPASLLVWAAELAEALLAQSKNADKSWVSIPAKNSESPWCLQERQNSDGMVISVLSSLNRDSKSPEKLTGVLRSQSFTAPEKLSFWLCGHQGFPKAEANQKNLVRLVEGGAQMPKRTASPPRTDVAQRIEWDLSEIKGKPVHFEIVDGDDGNAYAWLGAGGFEPALIRTDTFSSADIRQKQLKTLALILRTTAPVGLRDKLNAFLPTPPKVQLAKPQPEIEALLTARRAAFAKAAPDIAKGEALFAVNCLACHSLGGKGGLIGPQLDGIGNRGADRLIEDILDPNRNVDAHFHLHQIKLRDGSTMTGFVRGEVGQVIILADAAGNEQRIAKSDITEDAELPQSLMPPAFAQMIPADAFNDLVGWLLTR